MVSIVELGADPTGEDPVDGVLDEALANHNEIEFPEGEYLFNHVGITRDDWTLTGENATILLPDGGVDIEGTGWTFEGFEIDYRQQDGFGACFLGSDDWTFGNVVFRGTHSQDEKNTLIVPDVGTEALMHDVYAHEGGVAEGVADGKPKLMWTREIDGTLTIRRLWAVRWPENTLYLSDSDGTVVVEDSFFRNTNTGCIRHSEGIEARGCVFVVDGPIPGQWNEERRGATEFKGVWCNFNRGSGTGWARVEDCDFYYTHEDGVGSGVEMDGPGDFLTIDNCRFHSTFDVRMIDGVNADVDFGGTGNVISGGFRQNVDAIGSNRSDAPATDGAPPMPDPPPLGVTPGGPGDGDNGNGDDDLPHRLRIIGDGDDTTSVVFEVEVSGDLRELTPEEPTRQPDHGVDGSVYREDVWSGAEEIAFSGQIVRAEEIEGDGSATYEVNGQELPLEEIEGLPRSRIPGGSDTARTLTVAMVGLGTAVAGVVLTNRGENL